MNPAARNKQPPENIPVSASIFPCPYGWSSSAGLSDKRKPAQVITELKMSLADSIPSATSAYELPTTPTPILMIISETLMQMARIPRPSDSDAEGMKVGSADSDPPLQCWAEYGSARPILQQNVSTSRPIIVSAQMEMQCCLC